MSRFLHSRSNSHGWILTVAGNALARLLTFLFYCLVPSAIAVGFHAEILLFVLNLGMRIQSVLGSVNHSVLLPHVLLAPVEQRSCAESAYSWITNSYTSIYLLLVLLFALSVDRGMGMISGFPQEMIAPSHAIIILAALYSVVDLYATIGGDWCVANRFFSLPSFLSAVSWGVVCAYLLSSAGGASVTVLLTLMISTKIFQILSFQRISPRSVISRPCPGTIRPLATTLSAAYVGALATFAAEATPFFLLSYQAQGAVTAFVYAQLLASIPLVLLLEPTQQVLTRVNADTVSDSNWEAINASFSERLRHLSALMTVCAAYSWVVGRDLFSLIFSGSALPPDIIDISWKIFSILVWLAPFQALNTMAVKLAQSLRLARAASIYQVVVNLIGVAILWGSVRAFGFVGAGIGALVLNLLNALLLSVFFRIVAPKLHYLSHLRRSLLLPLVLGVLPAVSVYVLCPQTLALNPIARCALKSLLFLGIGAIAFAIANRIENNSLFNKLRDSFGELWEPRPSAH